MKLSDLEVVSRLAAKTALIEYKKEQKEKYKKAIIHNTETLLNNYLEIKYFFENCEDEGQYLDEEIVVGSLRKSKIATALLYDHARGCFVRLREQEAEKFKVIEMLYLTEQKEKLTWDNKLINIENELHISRRTIYNWRSEMITKLSIMLFGADGYSLILL